MGPTASFEPSCAILRLVARDGREREKPENEVKKTALRTLYFTSLHMWRPIDNICDPFLDLFFVINEQNFVL